MKEAGIGISLTAPSPAIETVLAGLATGIIVSAADGRIRLCNDAARQLLGLPDIDFVGNPPSLRSVIAHIGGLTIEPSERPEHARFSPRDGLVVELSVRALPGGWVAFIVADVTQDASATLRIEEAEARYHSLFDNSVYGIYRDTLDGQPLRANPALAAINGYASGREHIEAVKANPVNWYVAEDRAGEFRRILERDGRVSDFVSEVYRHRTGERLWVTENAWYVRGRDGKPICIEGTIQDASQRIASESALARLANIDALTGARSRHSLMQRLTQEAAKPGNHFLLYCVDLDMFKDVNDVFGHAAGDTVLKAITERLFALADGDTVVARLGGDEFAVLTLAPHHLVDPDIMARGIVQAMRLAVPVDGRNHYVGASVGIARFPDHGPGGEELLRNADTALYRAKSAGGNSWRMFDHQLRIELEHRKRLENALREAIARDQLELYYQPVVNAASGKTIGLEALMRWHHPEFGMVPPGEFIPVAEKAGMMTELGAWAISRACEAAAAFPPSIRIGVNVSANQFRSVGFFKHVKSELQRCGLAPGRLMLEITESVLVANERVARLILTALRKLGVQIAIDDFGTGFSSLSYLQHFPITCVKIDRSFVAGMTEQKANLSVIRAVVGIGRDLGIDVIAEGIETPEQAEVLQGEGCFLLQGYLYSKPKPLTDAATDLAIASLPAVDKPGLAKTG